MTSITYRLGNEIEQGGVGDKVEAGGAGDAGVRVSAGKGTEMNEKDTLDDELGAGKRKKKLSGLAVRPQYSTKKQDFQVSFLQRYLFLRWIRVK